MLPKLTVTLAVTFLAAASGAGVAAVRADHQLTAAQYLDHEIAQVLNAPDVVMKSARMRPGGTATVVLSRRDRALVFTTAGLPPPPAGQCYELWLVGPAGEKSAGMLPASRNGMTSPVFVAGLLAHDWASLTVEPSGGSARPTSPPILMLSLAT